MLTDFENFSLLETAINYLQNKCNTFRHLLKTLLHILPYETQKFKNCICCTNSSLQSSKLQVSTINFFKHLKKHTALLTYLLLCPATCVLITSSRSWGKVGHFGTCGLQQSAVDSAIDGERVAYQRRAFLSSDNMVIEWAVIEAVK